MVSDYFYFLIFNSKFLTDLFFIQLPVGDSKEGNHISFLLPHGFIISYYLDKAKLFPVHKLFGVHFIVKGFHVLIALLSVDSGSGVGNI